MLSEIGLFYAYEPRPLVGKGKLKFDAMPPADENHNDIRTRQMLLASLQGIHPNACVFKGRSSRFIYYIRHYKFIFSTADLKLCFASRLNKDTIKLTNQSTRCNLYVPPKTKYEVNIYI